MAAGRLGQSSAGRVEMGSNHDKQQQDTVHVGVEVEADGVHLTWEDLSVMASDGKGGSRAILAAVTGYAEPGEMVAIMGPSGCGKSTLLDALAGRLESRMRQRGNILVNGRRQRLGFGAPAYVTQDDILMTTLTVREAVCYSAQLRLPDSMPSVEKKARAEEIARAMGLQEVMDTRIGGYASKGISGGQKRRVSICIEILTRTKLLFLDEPTSGLDSAASYHVARRIAALARHEKVTVLASIHQPSSEVFELFDKLFLLSSGKTVYFGPTSMASEFFAVNGFPCPPLRNPSDHYLRTINKDFDKETKHGSGSGTATTAEAINVLTLAYEKSAFYRETRERVADICRMEGELVKGGSQANFATQCIVLTKRSFVNMTRDLGYYWLRFIISLTLCLCIGTIYHDIGHAYGSIQARGSMLQFVSAFLSLISIGGFPSFIEEMKVFQMERLNGHYGVAAFVVGNTLSSLPYLALISLIPAGVAYYLTGLQRGADRFFFFCMVLYISMMLVESLMLVVASIVPDFLMGIITGAGIQGVMTLSGGFFRLRHDLPKAVWRYPMHYIAFHKYALQAYFKNEFMGLSFEGGSNGSSISGEEIVRDYWQMEVGHSKWVDLGVLIGMVVLYRVLFLVNIKVTEKVKPMIRVLMAAPQSHATHVMQMPQGDDTATVLAAA